MNLALSFAEKRRAAGIATPMFMPIAWVPSPPPTKNRRGQGPRKQATDESKAEGFRTVECAAKEPVSAATTALAETLVAVQIAPVAELSAEQRTVWEARLDRVVTEIMGPRCPPPSEDADEEEPLRVRMALEGAACYLAAVGGLRILADRVPDAVTEPEIPRAQEAEKQAHARQEPEPIQALEAAPRDENADDQEETAEPEEAALVCRPAAPTREVVAARKGITHKDIAGDREAELIRRYQGGDRHAGEILLRAHAKFIGYHVSRYRFGRHDLAPEDLLAEAQMGFLKGVERFDPTMGWRLLTYAQSWMRQNMARAIADKGGTIRVPVGLQEKARRLQDNERTRAARNAFAIGHLDAPIGDDDGATLGDLVAGDDNPEATVADREWEDARAATLSKIMAALPEKLATVLRRRAAGETLTEIGDSLGISKERVRQLEREAQERARRAAVRVGLAEDEVVVEHARSPVTPSADHLARDGCLRCGYADHQTRTCDKWAGRKFGTWVVVRGAAAYRNPSGTIGGSAVVVRCESCSAEKTVRAAHLERGTAASCRCAP